MITLKKSRYSTITTVLVVIIICCITSCQKTPENLIVQSKADGELMIKIMTQNPADATPVPTIVPREPTPESATPAPPIPSGYKIIDHVKGYEKLVGGMELFVDTNVRIFDAPKIPVVKYRRKKFTEKDIQNTLDVLTGGKTLYEFQMPITKSEIEEIIISMKKDPDKNKRAIAELQKRYKDATDTPETPMHSGKMNTDGMLIGRLRRDKYDMIIRILPGVLDNKVFDNDTIGICYTACDKYGNGDLWNKLQDFRTIGLYELTERHQLQPVENAKGKINMTPEEAKNMATDVYKKLGAGDDVRVSRIYYVKVDGSDRFPKEDMHLYAIELKRYIVDDVPLKVGVWATVGMKRGSDFDVCNAGLPLESMTVFINDDGIMDLSWREPVERLEVMNENVQLAPYKEAMDIFWQEYKNTYSSMKREKTVAECENGIETCYPMPDNLFDIRLDYQMARIPNEHQAFVCIPIWNFYAQSKTKVEMKYNNGETSVREYGYEYNLIGINAIDNTRFNGREGY